MIVFMFSSALIVMPDTNIKILTAIKTALLILFMTHPLN